MAVKATIATGDWSTAGTWGLVDATSFSNSAETNHAVTTSYSGTRTVAFTPGAITISHLGVKLSQRTNTTGTFSIHLALNSTHVEVAGTEVTVNCSDFPAAATADLNGGWHFFKLASPVTLSAATAYELECTTSNSTQISLFRDGTSGNVARALITTTTGAPAAGDDIIINGEYTGQGTSNSFTVTYDITATTDFGSTPSAANSLIQPGIAVCNKGTLTAQTTSSTNYNLKVSNCIIVYSGGTFSIGTSGSEIPRSSTFTLTFDCGSNVDYGLNIRNLGTFNSYGLSRTSGKDVYYCLLNTDEAIASTSLGVDTDTGWLDNDEIAVASTTRTNTQCEAGALNGAAGASTLTVDGFAGAGGGLANAHSGTSPTQAEVILLTRNVLIIGVSATVQTYVNISATSTVTVSWTAFKWMGSATTNKRGVEINTTTGTCSITYSSFLNFTVASSLAISLGSNINNVTISNNVVWLSANIMLSVNSTSSSNITIDSNIFMRTVSNACCSIIDVGITFTNNIAIGANTQGFFIGENGVMGNFSGNVAHSCGSVGMLFTSQLLGTISNSTIWRCNSGGIQFSGGDFTISTMTIFGCNSQSMLMSSACGVTFINLTSSGDTTFSTATGIAFNGGTTTGMLTFYNADFSTVTGIKTAHTSGDISFGNTNALSIIKFINSKLGASPEISAQSSMSTNSIVSSQKHDQTSGLHKTWKRNGTITIETTTTHSGTTSIKMSPINALYKLESSGINGGFKVAVSSGQTCTPSIYVNEDVSYAGNRARLILKRNDAIGISADTVIDTATAASDGAWEQLTGTTIAATDDGVMEFVVDCDGVVGTLYVDSFSATVA